MLLLALAALGFFLLTTSKKTVMAPTPDGNFVVHPAQGNMPQWVSMTTASKKAAFVAFQNLMMVAADANGAAYSLVPLLPGQENANTTLNTGWQTGEVVWVDGATFSQLFVTTQGVFPPYPFVMLTNQGWPSPDMLS